MEIILVNVLNMIVYVRSWSTFIILERRQNRNAALDLESQSPFEAV